MWRKIIMVCKSSFLKRERLRCVLPCLSNFTHRKCAFSTIFSSKKHYCQYIRRSFCLATTFEVQHAFVVSTFLKNRSSSCQMIELLDPSPFFVFHGLISKWNLLLAVLCLKKQPKSEIERDQNQKQYMKSKYNSV